MAAQVFHLVLRRMCTAVSSIAIFLDSILGGFRYCSFEKLGMIELTTSNQPVDGILTTPQNTVLTLAEKREVRVRPIIIGAIGRY